MSTISPLSPIDLMLPCYLPPRACRQLGADCAGDLPCARLEGACLRFHAQPLPSRVPYGGAYADPLSCWYSRRRGRSEEAIFPTYDRMNSRGVLRRQFSTAGLIRFGFRQLMYNPTTLLSVHPRFFWRRLRATGEFHEVAILRWVDIIGVFRKNEA
jgi:hypothetical protein